MQEESKARHLETDPKEGAKDLLEKIGGFAVKKCIKENKLIKFESLQLRSRSLLCPIAPTDTCK